jgi:hypothetical protein
MNTLPIPLALTAAWLIFATSMAMIGAHALLAALAARRAGWSERVRVPVTIAGYLIAWLALALTAALTPQLAGLSLAGRLGLVLGVGLLPLLLAIVLLFASKTLARLYASMPSDWLIRIQIYRVLGFIFLPFLAFGAIPAAFALPAAFGDMLTGALSPLVANAVAQNRRGAYGWAVLWNLFGIADLIVAPAMAILSRSNLINIYPLALVGLFLGPPLGILTHLYSLRNLAAARRAGRVEQLPMAAIA